MLFNSIEFLLFFPLTTALYYLLPESWRWPMLLIASCIFYMAWMPVYILILFLIIVIDFFAAKKIEISSGPTRKLYLLVSVFANLSILFFFKYYNFFAENVNSATTTSGFSSVLPILQIILPIGLSFHTFQALSYTIEVFKGKQKSEQNIGIYALYVMFYPQLVAGPIERPQRLLHQFRETHPFNFTNLTMGLQLMLWGFFKKLVIADRLAPLVNHVYEDPTAYTGFPLLLSTYCFAMQIYCDFSGYTDIALGAAQVLGIKLVENFKSPYSASSIREFWQRWHISLSTWFRDYVYIPMGGSRTNAWRAYINVLIVFALSGFWHGANWTYLAWGLMHGLYLVVYISYLKIAERLSIGSANGIFTKLLSALGVFVTFNAVCFAWILFRAETLTDASWIMTHLFPLHGLEKVLSLGMSAADFAIALIAVIVLELGQFLQRRRSVRELIAAYPITIRWPIYYTGVYAVLLFGRFSSDRFIYFQF